MAAKPQGIAVHPAPGAGRDTLVQQVRRLLIDRGQAQPHVAAVSRLDRGTSGLVLLAIDPRAHPGLHCQVIRRQIRREYWCLVWGRPLFEETEIDLPLGRHWSDRKRVAVYDVPDFDLERWGARPARTHLAVIERFSEMALLSARLETGRMHQIRAHCQYIRLPIVGDLVYGSGGHKRAQGDDLAGRTASLTRQCLHAGRLEFRHPISDAVMAFDAPLPAPFADLLDSLRTESSPVLPVHRTGSRGVIDTPDGRVYTDHR